MDRSEILGGEVGMTSMRGRKSALEVRIEGQAESDEVEK